MNKVFLIGMPGSGKTTLGKALAEALSFLFVDMDEAIEQEQGERIASVFQSKGEPAFREIEKEMLKRLCQSNEAMVVATGGGAPCFYDNMDLINQSGLSVFLNVPLDEIAGRMEQAEIQKRPLLKRGTDPVLLQLMEKFKRREKYYKKARLTLFGNETLEQFAERIKLELKKASGSN